MNLIEELEGVGDLYDAKAETPFRTEVGYRLAVYQKRVSDGRGGSLPGLKHIEPTVDLTDHEIMDCLLRNRRLTLCLEDGRYFDFFVQSDSGNLVAAGAVRDKR